MHHSGKQPWLLHPSGLALSHEPSCSQRGRGECCRLKIDPCSSSRPLPSARAADLCRPEPAGEQSACVSLHPGLTFSTAHGARIPNIQNIKSHLLGVQSAERSLLPFHPAGSLGFATEAHCRFLAWWMVLESKPWAWNSLSYVRLLLILDDLQGHRLDSWSRFYV